MTDKEIKTALRRLVRRARVEYKCRDLTTLAASYPTLYCTIRELEAEWFKRQDHVRFR